MRRECKRPFRIYRPGFVVGDSKTGYIDKIDGPYYFFKLIQKMRKMLPPWVPTIGIEGGRINIVPVDFVADALDYLAHKNGLDGKCFHLTDPDPYRIGEVLNIFARGSARAADDDARQREACSASSRRRSCYGLGSLAPVKRAMRVVLTDLGIPKDVFQFVNWPTRYDNREAAKALKGSGIEVPAARHLRAHGCGTTGSATSIPISSSTARLAGRVRDKVVVVTGGSSGIGQATALKLAEAGAKVILVARDAEKLVETARRSTAAGGTCVDVHRATSPTSPSCDALVKHVLADHGGCDFLVNNAGRSIRRAVINSFDRFHDFERTMQLNYFGALRLIMGFLPQHGRAASAATSSTSRRSACCRTRRASRRTSRRSRRSTRSRHARRRSSSTRASTSPTINMPLVRTPMIAPTKMYENVPTLSPEEAAGLVVEAIVYKPVRIATRLGIFGAVCHAIAPKITQVLLNTAFNMFPDSAAAQGKKERRSRSR